MTLVLTVIGSPCTSSRAARCEPYRAGNTRRSWFWFSRGCCFDTSRCAASASTAPAS